jgi:alkanal monooxygenase alpha chain
MLDWGLYLTTAQPDGENERDILQHVLEFSELAEQLDYHSVWLLEHHFTRYGLCGSPLVMGSHLLGRTSRIKLGTAVSVLPLEHPLRVAESVALLDHLSSGRFIYGVGRGFFLKDFEVFGVDVKRNHELLEQFTEILIKAWTETTVSWDSELISFPEVEVLPKPYTLPHPPLYVACSSPTRTEWAARHGFPMMMDYLNSHAEKRAQTELYNEVAAEHGHDPSEISHMLSCVGFVGDRSALEGVVKDTMIWWEYEFLRASKLFEPEFRDVRSYEFYFRQRETAKLAGRWLPEHRAEELLNLNPNGSPAECIERLNEAIEGCNIGLVVMGFEALRDPGLIRESMTRFAEEVAPHVASSMPV